MKQVSWTVVFLLFLVGDPINRESQCYCSTASEENGCSLVQFSAVVAFQSNRIYHYIRRYQNHFSTHRSLSNNEGDSTSFHKQSSIIRSRKPKSTQHGSSRSHFLSTLISTPALVVTTATLLTIMESKEVANAGVDLNLQQQEQSLPVAQLPSLTSTTDVMNTSSSLLMASVESSTWEQSLAGLISGLVLTACKTTIKYPADTAVVRLQMPNTPYTIYDPITLFRGCFQGLPAQLAGTLPSGAIFFAVKDAVKAYLNSNYKNYPSNNEIGSWIDWNAFITTSIAVAVAQPPYWLIRNPSEVIKTREQVSELQQGLIQYNNTSGVVTSSGTMFNTDGSNNINNNTITWDGVKDLYSGYWENVFYAYPADLIKFAVYEILVSSSLQRKRNKNNSILNSMNKSEKKVKVGPLEGAIYGAFSTALAQGVTTPLDVVRNRIMVKKDATQSSLSYIDTLIELGRKEGMKGLFAGAGLKVAKAIVSGGIQFAAYESTNQSIQNMLEKKKK